MRVNDSELVLRSGWADPLWMQVAQQMWDARRTGGSSLLPRIEMKVRVGGVEQTYVFTGDVSSEYISPNDLTQVRTTWRAENRGE